MDIPKDLRIALLIDAENVPHSNLKEMLEELAKYGTPTFKRIYADWTKPAITGWKSILLENAITPIQQYSYTTGKNSSDNAMIIDAMDILHDEKVDGFCLVSSDSDFTRLAIRLRESGKLVIGIGEKKTPNPFIVACDKFIYIEIIGAADTPQPEPAPKTTGKRVKKIPAQAVNIDPMDNLFIKLIKSSINDLADDSGWAFLAEVGALLIKKKPDFDPRNYGFPKLMPLIKSLTKHFEIDEREVENKNIKRIYVRNKTDFRPKQQGHKTGLKIPAVKHQE